MVMGAADGCLYIERECKTEDSSAILGSQTPVVCLCTSVCVRIRTIDRACVPTLMYRTYHEDRTAVPIRSAREASKVHLYI